MTRRVSLLARMVGLAGSHLILAVTRKRFLSDFKAEVEG